VAPRLPRVVLRQGEMHANTLDDVLESPVATLALTITVTLAITAVVSIAVVVSGAVILTTNPPC